MTKIGIYPGTFDPITVGHVDIIARALKVVDKLIIAVADDIPKTPMFSLEERVEVAKESIAAINGADRAEVVGFKGLLISFAQENNASLIIRGLRAVSDFEYEFQMACMNSTLDDTIETIFLPAAETTHYISSRFVKEIARLGGDVEKLLPAASLKAVREKLS